MTIFLAVLLAAQPVPDAQPSDLKSITRTSDAAEQCGLTDAGVAWKEMPDGSLSITLATSEMLPAMAQKPQLTQCFFPWAYKHDVKVVFGLAEAKP